MEQLCNKINMPREVTQKLCLLDAQLPRYPQMALLRSEETWDEGLAQLRNAFGADDDGMKELCCMLRCGLEAKGDFEKLGFSEDIYYGTMGCFSRFVREHKESYGTYGFDRGFWAVRQIACRLFRMGQLEYELTTLEDVPAVSIHIPTDAVFTPEEVQSSLNLAKTLLKSRFPDYAAGPWFCHSWLLSPTLQQMLPESSNILSFQRRFRIRKLEHPCEGMQQWVFKNPKLSVKELPEQTSLQRKIKVHLLAGETFWDARGVMLP